MKNTDDYVEVLVQQDVAASPPSRLGGVARAGQGPKPTKNTIRSINLTSQRHCRKFLAKLVNHVYRGEIDGSEAARMGFLVGLILRSLQSDKLTAEPTREIAIRWAKSPEETS